MKKLASAVIFVSISAFSTLAQANVPVIQDQNYCTSNQVISNWNHMMETVHNHSEADKVHAVNSFFNIHLRYAEDANNWNRDNFWATPFESMVRGQGDCEDFAIAKFKTLILLGVPENRLHLHHVNIVNPRFSIKTPHMVVVYQNEEGQRFVLDNIDGRVIERENRSDLVTLFAFNTNDLKIGSSITQHSPVERIQQWRNAISRFDRQSPLCISY